uniref:Uncharacterized protein n=1 Tax=Arundo donax TaxID=35708 RepID=A0A0A9BYK8_ARUDO
MKITFPSARCGFKVPIASGGISTYIGVDSSSKMIRSRCLIGSSSLFPRYSHILEIMV